MSYREEESPAAVVLVPDRPADASVIWMHGLGADGYDFVPLVPELGLPADLAPRFVFPHAEPRPVTVNGGMVMRAWYDIASLDSRGSSDDTGIRGSVAAIARVIGAERALGIASERILLAGFSQGGVIALHTALRHAERLAGVLALSTYLPLADALFAECSAANAGLPVLMCHGREDGVLPLALGQAACAALRARGYPVEWREYPMAHAVCAPEVGAISAWLKLHLQRAAHAAS
jgi:phospholipase/carboxylesterase